MVVSCILPRRALTRRQSANDDSSYTRHIAEPPRHPSHHHVGLAGWLAGRTVTHGTHGVVSSQCFSLSRQSVGAAQRSLDDDDDVCCPMMDHEPSASPERATGRGPARRRVRKRAETARLALDGWLADGSADRGFACPGRRSTRKETSGGWLACLVSSLQSSLRRRRRRASRLEGRLGHYLQRTLEGSAGHVGCCHLRSSWQRRRNEVGRGVRGRDADVPGRWFR